MDTRIDYGQDAPGLMRGFLAAALAAWIVVLLTWVIGSGIWVGVVIILVGVAALYLTFMGCFMIYESRIGKVRDRDRILNRLAWRGDEKVLDIGCGRGLMLIGGALRAPKGLAIGIDLWRQEDQAHNSQDATLQNAAKAGVADRVSVQTADMQDLPFQAGTFDVILSSWAIHNLPARTERERALSDAMRVLRPGGQMALTDIEGRAEYPHLLQALGAQQVQVIVLDSLKDRVISALSFGSFAPFTVMAQKPL